MICFFIEQRFCRYPKLGKEARFCYSEKCRLLIVFLKDFIFNFFEISIGTFPAL